MSVGSTNQELDELASQLKIPNYVPCKMKDELRLKKVGKLECGIVNLQNLDQAGSHWVMYYKDDMHAIAYSSFGDPAPQELIDYLCDKEKREESGGKGHLPLPLPRSARSPLGPGEGRGRKESGASSSLGPFPERNAFRSSPSARTPLEDKGTQIFTSDIQIQDFSEKSCGYYCIAILYLLLQKIPFEDIVLGFKKRGAERGSEGSEGPLPPLPPLCEPKGIRGESES